MTCKPFEKMISDRIDGVLSEKNQKKLEKHMLFCSSCTAYDEQLRLLHSGASLIKGEVSEAYMNGFSARLRDKLIRLKEVQSRSRRTVVPRWAYAAVPLLAVVIVYGYLLLSPRRDHDRIPPLLVVSMEENIQRITDVIASDPELETVFNGLLLVSIQELLEGEDVSLSGGNETPFSFVDSLTEEELKILEAQIKKQTKT